MAFPIALRLAIRQWRARPLRPVLCSLAIAAAVALIICVGVAMDSLGATISNAIGKAMGVAEFFVRPNQYGTDARIPESMMQQIKALPEVELVDGRLHSFAYLDKGQDHLFYDVWGIDLVQDEKLRPKTLKEGRLLSEDPEKAKNEILIDDLIAGIMNLKLGETIDYKENDDTPHKLTIVGILHRPNLDILGKPTMYVSYDFLLKDMKIPRSYNMLDIKLKPRPPTAMGQGEELDYDAYAKNLNTLLGDSVQVLAGTTAKAKLGDTTRTLRLLLLLLSTMAAICAALIIGTTLSVGIQERVRQFGQLRCIGASRGQLAQFLLGDALVLWTLGEGLGLILGFALAWGLMAWFPQYFADYSVSWASLASAIFSGGFATLLGSMIPIWQVTRVSPMAAVSATAQRPRISRVKLAFFLGISCLLLQAALWIFLPTRETRFYTYAAVGIPLIFTGWCLLAPGIVMICERFGSAAIGRLMFVQPALLKSAWSRTPWRAGAMIAALMIGVTLYTTVRSKGQSVLASWTTPARIPDIIGKNPMGIHTQNVVLPVAATRPATTSSTAPSSGAANAGRSAEIVSVQGQGDALTVDVKLEEGGMVVRAIVPETSRPGLNLAPGEHVQVALGDIAKLRQRIPALSDITTFDYFGTHMADKVFQLGSLFSEGETTFIAVDPASFANMLELEYLQGDPKTAVAQLGQGNYVFVSKEFYNVRKLGVGSKIRLVGADGKPVEFTIAAVVTSTGVELVQNFFDLRASVSEKATSSVLGSLADAHKYFRLGDPTMILANVRPADAGPDGMAKVLDLMKGNYFAFSSVELKSNLFNLIRKVINGLSIIGIGALCVASLGVANMVIASIHAKRFEFGVLRAIGAGRFQLVRLVLAEVTLIGLVAGLLGAAAGLHLSFMGNQVDLLLIGLPSHFLSPDVSGMLLLIAWFLLTAILLTTVLAWLAALAPAINGARAAQRILLASGRV